MVVDNGLLHPLLIEDSIQRNARECAVGTYFRKAQRGKIRWRLLDAEGRVLGRLAANAARMMLGKDCPDFSPHEDHRDGVIVINAAKVRLTGKKLDQKFYRRHSNYPGGLREISARELLASKPERMVREAIVGMLPKSRLGDRMAARVKVYAGPTHPHTAQDPEPVTTDR